jgi:hypothetical protein
MKLQPRVTLSMGGHSVNPPQSETITAHPETTPGVREQSVISLELRAQPAMTFVIRQQG